MEWKGMGAGTNRAGLVGSVRECGLCCCASTSRLCGERLDVVFVGGRMSLHLQSLFFVFAPQGERSLLRAL